MHRRLFVSSSLLLLLLLFLFIFLAQFNDIVLAKIVESAKHPETTTSRLPTKITKIGGGGENDLGSICYPLDGCGDRSLICFKNRCECAPGFVISSHPPDRCVPIRSKCFADSTCRSRLDPNRRCDRVSGQCIRCARGTRYDSVVNRCVTTLGYGCNRTSDCEDYDHDDDDDDEDDRDRNLNRDSQNYSICRAGRCVCKPDYYPAPDWSRCRRHECSLDSHCNPFGDDRRRRCRLATRRCVCEIGFYDDQKTRLCLPYISVQYSLMMPFFVTMIVVTICILLLALRRLKTGSETRSSSGGQSSSRRSSIFSIAITRSWARNANANRIMAPSGPMQNSIDVLDRPPPRYDDVVPIVKQNDLITSTTTTTPSRITTSSTSSSEPRAPPSAPTQNSEPDIACCSPNQNDEDNPQDNSSNQVHDRIETNGIVALATSLPLSK